MSRQFIMAEQDRTIAALRAEVERLRAEIKAARLEGRIEGLRAASSEALMFFLPSDEPADISAHQCGEFIASAINDVAAGLRTPVTLWPEDKP